MKYKLTLLFFSAFLIRLISLNQSLWLDEAITAQVVKTFSYTQIITQFSPQDFHPPGFYLFMKLWSSFFGYYEIMLRLPSLLFSLATGWFIYLIAKMKNEKLKIKNYDLGFWAAALFLLNPLIIYYSQEARMYMMVTFLLTAAFYFFLRIIDFAHQDQVKSHIQNILLFSVCVFLSFLTFYGSIFFIISFYVYLIWKKELRLLLFMIPGFILSFIVVAPLLYQQLAYSREVLQSVTHWNLVLGTVTLKNLFLIPIKFTSGRISFEPKILYYAIAGFWTVITFFFAGIGGWKDKRLAFFFVFPLVLATIFSFFSPLLQYFRFLYLIPILSMLIMLGIINFKADLIQRSDKMKIIIVSVFLLFSLLYLFFPQFHREDWKELAYQIQKKDAEAVYMIPSASDPIKYYLGYNSDFAIIDISTLIAQKNLPERLYIIPYVTAIHGVDYKTVLVEKGYFLEKEEAFRGVTLETWKNISP